jgi:hypothetical protein
MPSRVRRNSSLHASLATVALTAFALCPGPTADAQSALPDTTPSESEGRYDPDQAGNSIPLPGYLFLSASSARFEQLHGKMRLSFAGRMPTRRDSETSGALVYEVVNAEVFSAANRDRQLCRGEPIRWLFVRPYHGALRLGWLTSRDWHAYRPDSAELCFAQTYDLNQ